MTDTAPKPHWTHWVISGLLLMWNALGCVNFFFQFDPTYVASLPPEYQAIIENRPTWAAIGFGVAVIGGAFGAILLLLRSRQAVPIFLISAVGATAAVVDSFTWGGVMQVATAVAAAIYARVSSDRRYPGQCGE